MMDGKIGKPLFGFFLTISLWAFWPVPARGGVFFPGGKRISPGSSGATRPDRRKNWKRTDLFFGGLMVDGSRVGEKEYLAFIETEVTPRFPDGFTMLAGFGQFRNRTGAIVREPSMLVIIVYPASDHLSNRKIEEIRRAYRLRFRQESVLRTDFLVGVDF